MHGPVTAVLAADGNPFPPDLGDDALTALVATHEEPPGTRPVDAAECAAAWKSTASAGGVWSGSCGRGCSLPNLNATRYAIIRVCGESMEPTLLDGCPILFDRNRREGRIYVVRTDAGLIVMRAAMRGGAWDLASDNPAVEPEPWPANAGTVGAGRLGRADAGRAAAAVADHPPSSRSSSSGMRPQGFGVVRPRSGARRKQRMPQSSIWSTTASATSVSRS